MPGGGYRTLLFEMADGRCFKILANTTEGSTVVKDLVDYELPLRMFQYATTVIDVATESVLKNRYNMGPEHVLAMIEASKEWPWQPDISEWMFDADPEWPGCIRIER